MFVDLGYLRGAMYKMSKVVTEASGHRAFVWAEWSAALDAASRGLRCRAIRLYDAAPASGDAAPNRQIWQFLQRIPNVDLRIRNSLEPPLFQQREVDVDLATDLLSAVLRGKCDWAILLSGDRDFLPVVEKAQAAGCKVRVAQFCRTSPGRLLAEQADDVVDLDAAPVLRMVAHRGDVPLA